MTGERNQRVLPSGAVVRYQGPLPVTHDVFTVLGPCEDSDDCRDNCKVTLVSPSDHLDHVSPDSLAVLDWPTLFDLPWPDRAASDGAGGQ